MAGTKLVLCGLVALGALSGCGGDDKQAVTGQPTATQCAPGQYFDGRICQSPTGAAPTATTPVGTAPTAAPPATIPGLNTATPGPSATPLDPAAAQIVTSAIGPLAVSAVAPGAKPVGSAIAGNFAQGQTLEAVIQMNPGKCYTIVGAGAPGITNLDIQLVMPVPMPGLPAVVAAADSTQAPTAIVGQQPNCYKWAFAMGGTMKVVLSVPAGQGIAAAQVFEK